jgi:hypothetical protein
MVKKTNEPSESLIKFYTSLLKQRPDSEMAIKWCQKHNLIEKKKDMVKLISKLKI